MFMRVIQSKFTNTNPKKIRTGGCAAGARSAFAIKSCYQKQIMYALMLFVA